MRNTHAALSRRSVLASGLALSLLGVSAGAIPLSQTGESVLSGRITDERGFPMRHAQVRVAGVRTLTDGDGRFFLRAALPTQGHISLHVVLVGQEAGTIVSGLPERTHADDRDTSSLSLIMAS